jgi:hypothetical protein
VLLSSITLAATLGLSGQPWSVPSVSPKEFQSVLSGSWDQGNDFQALCGPDRVLHTATFSEDGQMLTFKFERPRKIFNGKEVTSLDYRVLGATNVSLILAMKEESRKDENGQPFVWELVIVGPELFRWRATSFAVATYNDVWGRRCK